MTDNDKRSARVYLESCALGYGASVQAGGIDDYAGAKDALHDAGVRLAAALGNLDAAERAELVALRRFREGVEALRGEMATGQDYEGSSISEPREHAIETVDALLYFASPNHTTAKETA